MINPNDILAALYQRIIIFNDPVYLVTRSKKTDGSLIDNPCYSCNMGSLTATEDSDLYSGTIIINAFADNLSDGAPNIEKLSSMIKAVGDELHNKPLMGSGFFIYSQYIETFSGFLHNEQYPDEHYVNLKLKLNAKEA